MIVKDEEELLEGCLESIHNICDEIIIMDTGSTDRTKEIAQQFTNKIYDFEWIDDFSAARNAAFEKATKDYILWLDADDILAEEDQKKLIELKEELDGSQNAVSMLYRTAFDEFGEPAFQFRRHRIVKRSCQFKWHGAVHEYLEVNGPIIESDISITHRKHEKTERYMNSRRNLEIYEGKLERKEKLSARDMFYYANELKDHNEYKRAIIQYHLFLASNKGWIEDEIRACFYMADCYSRLGNTKKELESLSMTMQFDLPRPEASCRLGDYQMKMQNFDKAVVWYKLALERMVKGGQGFTHISYETWYPHLQLCVCYYNLGQLDLAIEHNQQAKKYRPEAESIKNNEEFFKMHLNEQ